MAPWLLALHLLTQPPAAPDEPGLLARAAGRLRGGALLLAIRPNMTAEQVADLLGPPDSFAGSGWLTSCYYYDMGLSVCWYRPAKMWSPAGYLGPGVMCLVRALPP